MKIRRFLLSSAVGLAFFLLPIPVADRYTVPFDVVVQWIIGQAPGLVAAYCLASVLVGALATCLAYRKRGRFWDFYRTSHLLAGIRVAGVPLAVLFAFGMGPEGISRPAVSGLMWETLAVSVGIIVPIGAALLALFVEYGFLDFVGTLMRPVMRPLFRLPGRSALDSLTSWIGSYSVGLYLTRKLLEEGHYTRREAYTIVTCFSTVSIGFVAVVTQTLAILHLFPLVFGTYFVAVYVLTGLFARLWPVTAVPDAYLVEPELESAATGGLVRSAWNRALSRAEAGPPLGVTIGRGFTDGLRLASTILGSILVVGTSALLLARETPLFDWIGRPLVPVLGALGLPDPELLAPASVVGVAEMYIPALLVREAALPGRFFIAVLSISQLVFFSSVAPMMLDMFRKVPIRAGQLLAIFAMRTAVLVPLLAGVTRVLLWLGLLA